MLAIQPRRALNDHRPLAGTLERLVDFARLNASEVELQVVTVDVETGEEVWFSNRGPGLVPEHLLAATAFPPLYPAVEVDGRLLCDAGLANNLPIDRAFELEPSREMLCVAVDLFSLSHDRPEGLDGMIARAQDIVFASQARRSIAAVARERALARRLDPSSPTAVLAHVAFRAPPHQRSLKTIDYSRASIKERSEQGSSDMAAMLARIEAERWNQPLAAAPVSCPFGLEATRLLAVLDADGTGSVIHLGADEQRARDVAHCISVLAPEREVFENCVRLGS